MKLECCGKRITTPFCPICGSKCGSANSLLGYLRLEYIRESDRLSGYEHLLKKAKAERNIRRVNKCIDTQKRKVQRISSWIDWIEDKIQAEKLVKEFIA